MIYIKTTFCELKMSEALACLGQKYPYYDRTVAAFKVIVREKTIEVRCPAGDFFFNRNVISRASIDKIQKLFIKKVQEKLQSQFQSQFRSEALERLRIQDYDRANEEIDQEINEWLNKTNKEVKMTKNKWKVVGFCKYFMDEKDYLYPDVPYAELSKRDAADIDRAIVNFLADTDTYFVPDQHQSEELHCVPVVENDGGERYQATFSLRAWGHIMGLAFGGDYMDYYCSRPEDHPGKIKLPDPDLYLD